MMAQNYGTQNDGNYWAVLKKRAIYPARTSESVNHHGKLREPMT